MPDDLSAAKEIVLELADERAKAYVGLDGVFQAIWAALEAYPEYTILILDEIDHITQDSNYDPNDFFYRLFRGEGRLKRGLNLSVFLVSNELLTVDLRLDSRVQSTMSGEEIFFPPYDAPALEAILGPRLDRAFRDGALPPAVRDEGIRRAATQWGDVRKALTLFRQAGEAAAEQGLEEVTTACLAGTVAATEKETTIAKLVQLPARHLAVLTAVVSRSDASGAIIQPVTTAQIHETLSRPHVPDEFHLGQRAIRDVIGDLETMGLVETWIDSRGRDGRVKLVETLFNPQWVRDAQAAYRDQGRHIDESDR